MSVSGLRHVVISGIGWRGSVDIAQVLLQVAFTVILARLLGLSDFGLVAMCLVFIRFVRAFTEAGWLATAVIQSQEISAGQISALFFVQLFIKTGAFVLCVVAAPLAATFFNQPLLVDLIRVLSLIILFDSLAIFPQTLLRKQLRFRGYSLIELAAMVAGDILGIVAALAGFGVWSLVVRQIAQRAIYAAILWPVVGWWPARADFRGLGPHLKFGASLFASSTLSAITQNIAAIVIGKLISVETLGLYSVAYNLATVPAQKIKSTFNSVLMPVFSKLQSDLESVRKNLNTVLFVFNVMFCPLMMGLAAVGRSFVELTYGVKWAQAGDFLILLSFLGLFKGMEYLLQAILIALGRPTSLLIVMSLEMVVSVPFLWIATERFGIWGLLAAYVLVSTGSLLLTTALVQRALADKALLVRSTWRSFIAGSIMFSLVSFLPYVIQVRMVEILLIQLLVGVISYIALRSILLSRTERQMIRSVGFSRGKTQ